MAVVAMAGFAFGSTMRKNTPSRVQPSMMAAFSKVLGDAEEKLPEEKDVERIGAVNILVRNSAAYVFDELHIHNDLVVRDKRYMAGDHHRGDKRQKQDVPSAETPAA